LTFSRRSVRGTWRRATASTGILGRRPALIEEKLMTDPHVPAAAVVAVAPSSAPPRLLIVLDETALGRRCAEIGVALAARLRSHACFLLPLPLEPVAAASAAGLEGELAAHHARCHERAQPLFDAALALAAAAGVEARTLLTIDEDPCPAVQRVASEIDCTLIVVGSLGRSAMQRALHGSLVADLVRLSPWPLLVCREDSQFDLQPR
jgi:nucleotide-binding universal stress UspA family protein